MLCALSGTPEYLSPSTVKNQACGVEVDLWALGVVLFQMLLGYTPYGAPSPYLTFLRIRRSFLQVRGAVIEYRAVDEIRAAMTAWELMGAFYCRRRSLTGCRRPWLP
jgi:serine/threonine protein kinase